MRLMTMDGASFLSILDKLDVLVADLQEERVIGRRSLDRSAVMIAAIKADVLALSGL